MITTFDSAQINWNQWKCVRIKCSWICFLRTMWMKFENSKDEKSSETNCHKTELNLQKKREKKWNFKRKVKCIPIKKWIVGDMRECVRVCLYVCRSSRQVICLRNMRIITIGNMRPRAMHRPKCRYLRQCYSIMSIYVCARVWWALNTSNAVPWITILLMFILSISHICRECIHAQKSRSASFCIVHQRLAKWNMIYTERTNAMTTSLHREDWNAVATHIIQPQTILCISLCTHIFLAG